MIFIRFYSPRWEILVERGVIKESEIQKFSNFFKEIKCTVEPRITGLRITGQTRITGQDPGADALH